MLLIFNSEFYILIWQLSYYFTTLEFVNRVYDPGIYINFNLFWIIPNLITLILIYYTLAFQNTAVAQSKITYINGDTGVLRYRYVFCLG